MASVKTVLGDLVGRLLFREAVVTGVRDVSPRFRRLTLAGKDLTGIACSPGDKVQLYLPSGDMRTYTPFAYDGARGEYQLLVYLHAPDGDTPGASWGRSVAAGARVRLFGPRGSLPLTSLTGPVILFGDETSFAVARTLGERASAGPASLVFEVTDAAESRRVLDDLGVGGCELVARREADGHLPAVSERLRAALAANPGAQLVLTGRAQSIQQVRAALKAQPAAPGGAGQKVKAYWSVGKRGLD